MSRLDDAHDRDCPVIALGADPDQCACDLDGAQRGGGRSRRSPDADCRPPWRRQSIEMGRLWRAAGVGRRAERLALTGALLDRPAPESSRELTVGDADVVLRQLRGLDTAGQLRTWADETLATLAPAETGGDRP